MLRKIYHELVVIRKELQAIRSILEHKAIRFDTKGIAALKELMNTNFESEAKIRISYEQDVCTYSPFLALAFPCTGAYKVCKSNGPLFAVMAD